MSRAARPTRGERVLTALRGRAVRLGIDALDTAELLDLLLDAVRGGELLGQRDLLELSRSRSQDLAASFGLGPQASLRLEAAFELGRRIERRLRPARPSVRTADRVHRLIAPELRGLEREAFLVLLLDGRHRLRRCEWVSEGTLTTSLVHPREFFRPAVRESAAAVIAVHNHPSGDPEPSLEDLEVTRRLAAAGRTLGIPLLDHVVVTEGGYVSIRERIAF